MHRIRKTVAIASLAALAITMLAAPASALPSKGTIGVVNGIPGQRVDICINGKEIRSNVKYGGRVHRTMLEGTKVVKVYKANPRTCKGVKLAKKVIGLGGGGDLTIVFNKQAPRVVVFDNAGLGFIPPGGTPLPTAPFAWRHAADLGRVQFKYTLADPEQLITPAVAPVWIEGDQFATDVDPGTGMRLRATRPGKAWTIAKSPFLTLEAGRRYEWYLLGTTAKNAKFIVWGRPVSGPA